MTRIKYSDEQLIRRQDNNILNIILLDVEYRNLISFTKSKFFGVKNSQNILNVKEKL